MDTGKLLIADPDYVESYWRLGTNPPGHPPYVLSAKGRKLFPKLAKERWTFPFPWGDGKFSAASPLFKGKSINEMRNARLIDEVDRDPAGEFSLNGACLAVDKTVTGELTNDIGAKIGFVTSTGYGDGVYPVYIRKDKDGRVAELVIKFMEDAS